MDRLRLWLLPIYAVIGFMAIVVILPTSRWVVLTQWDVIAGRWKYLGDNRTGLTSKSFVHPIQRGLDDRDPAPDEIARFLRAIAPTEIPSDATLYNKHFFAAFDICKAKNDPRYWAQFVRVAAFHGQVKINTPNQQRFDMPDDRPVQTLLKTACEAGSKVDPDNAFFQMMLSGVLNRLGDLNASRDAYLRASTLTRYDDYVMFEPQLRYRYLVDHYGERGHQLKAIIYSDTYLQHLGTFYSLARYYSRADNPEGRLATIKLGALIVSRSKSAIDVVIGHQIMTWGLDPSRIRSARPLLPTDAARREAQDLQKDVHSNIDVGHVLDVYNSIPSDMTWPPAKDEEHLVLNLRPALSAWSLWALILLPFCIGFAWLKSRSDRFAAASPYLVWLIPLASDSLFGTFGNSPTIFGATSLLFILALFPKIRRYLDWLGMLVVALAFIPWASYALVTPIILFLVSLVFERRIKTVPTYATIAGVLAACVFASGAWVMMACRIDPWTGFILGTLVTIGVSSAIPVRAPAQWLAIAGSSSLALGVWFAVMVANDLSADKQMVVISNKLLNDADDLRKQSH